MKGKILFYDSRSNSGKISGEDSVRYDFVQLDWIGDGVPKEGLDVDFEVVDGKTKDIFSLKTGVNNEGKWNTGIFVVLILVILFVPYIGGLIGLIFGIIGLTKPANKLQGLILVIMSVVVYIIGMIILLGT